MHPITLSYTLSYAAAVRMGVARAGTGQLDAERVLPLLDPPTRAWLALHPQASFRLDDVVEVPLDLEGERLAQCLAREVRSAADADDPRRLEDAVSANFIRKLKDARAGAHIATYVSIPRRVSDGSNCLSGSLERLTDRAMSPVLLHALERHLDQCLAALIVPHIAGIEAAPKWLREVYDAGVRRIVDRAHKSAQEQAVKHGPLPYADNFDGAREYQRMGALGLTAQGTGPDRTWRVTAHGSTFRDLRFAGLIEESVAAAEAYGTKLRDERQAAREAREQAVLAVLTEEQRARHALKALDDEELEHSLQADLTRRLRAALEGLTVSRVDTDDEEHDEYEESVAWGLLPRGGSDVVARLKALDYVERWGRSGRQVVLEARTVDGSYRSLYTVFLPQ